MKKLLIGMGSATLLFGLLGMAATPAAIKAETTNPQPGLDGATVRLCEEGLDADGNYCSSPGETLATQTAITRVFTTLGGPATLPGTYRFTSAELASGNGGPRAVVFGPISGTYSGYASAWIWGFLCKNASLQQPLVGIPTELHQTTLGAPGAGLATSQTGSVGREYTFPPLATFYQTPYYVTVYLDQSLPGGPANPGIGSPNTLDGQVWGWQTSGFGY